MGQSSRRAGILCQAAPAAPPAPKKSPTHGQELSKSGWDPFSQENLWARSGATSAQAVLDAVISTQHSRAGVSQPLQQHHCKGADGSPPAMAPAPLGGSGGPGERRPAGQRGSGAGWCTPPMHNCTYIHICACTFAPMHAHTCACRQPEVTCTHTCTYIHAHMHVHVGTHVSVHTRARTRTLRHRHTAVHVHACACTHRGAHLCVFTRPHACMDTHTRTHS